MLPKKKVARSLGKRADVTDILIFSILVFTFAIILFTFTFIIPEITDGLRSGGLNNTPEGSNAIDQLESFGSNGIQRGFFLVFVGLLISNLISAFLVRTHPIFLFLYIFILIITVLIGTYLGNAYDQLRNIPIFAEQLATQTLFNIVMENYIIIILGTSALSMVIAFSKFSSAGRSVQGQL